MFKKFTLFALFIVFNSIQPANAASPDDFVITVKTDNPGNSTDLQFNISTNPGATYNYNVDCDNDETDEITGATDDYLCSYTSAGTYTIRIKDNTGTNNGFPRISLSDKGKILTLEQWGANKWTSMHGAFQGTTNLTLPATDDPDLSSVTSLGQMFVNASSANPDTSNWDTSSVTRMFSMFGGASSANPNTSNWDTSAVLDMGYMFRNAISANPDTSNWDTSSVIYMLYMFWNATSANPNTSNWDTSSVTRMDGMFNGATSAKPDTSNWDTSSVTRMDDMFNSATSAKPDTSNWNIENVTTMEDMFAGVTLSTADYDAMLIGFNAQNLQTGVSFHGGNSKYCAIAAHNNLESGSGHKWNITDGGIDSNCPGPSDDFVITVKTNSTGDSTDLQFNIPTKSGLTYNYNVDCDNDGTDEITGATGDYLCSYASVGTYTIRIKDNTGSNNGFPHIYFNGVGDKDKIITIEQWGANKWTSMRNAFKGTTNLTVPATDNPDLLLVTSISGMFEDATSANPDTSNWDTSAVTNMFGMFDGATSANPDTSNWDTSAVRYMGFMFREATSANPDTSNWDTSSVTRMDDMFREATSANPNTSNWDTSAVTNMHNMFSGATSANPDTSNWDTSAVISMNGMFRNVISANPDTSNWDTSAVTRMDSMFSGATSANPITSNWDTSAVTNMLNMFSGATSVNPDTSNWDTSAVTNMLYMFSGATSANPDTSNWDTSAVTSMHGMFRNATSANPDTSNWDTSAVTSMFVMFNSATSANPDTSNWNIENVTTMENMFAGVTLPTADYDAMLIGFNAQNLQSNVVFSGGDSVYCSVAAIAAHNNLESTSGHSWTITDGGGGVCDVIFTDGFEQIVTFKASDGYVEYDFNNLPNLSANEQSVLIAQGLGVDNNPIIEIHARRFEDETHIRISFLYPEDREDEHWTHESWEVLENKGLTNIYWE